MRHPTTLGAVVLGALLLALVALLHLVAARRTTGHRLLWAAISLFVPFVGPLAYLLYGRTLGQMDDEPDEAAPVFAPRPPAATTRPAPTASVPRIAPLGLRPAPLPPVPMPPEPPQGSPPARDDA